MFFFLRFEIFNVRDQVVDTGHVFFRELEAHVNDDDIIVIFVDIHASRDLSAAAQRGKLKMPFAQWRRRFEERRSLEGTVCLENAAMRTMSFYKHEI